MNQPLTPVERSVTVRLYDFIEEKGIDSFVANGAQHFKQFNIDTHPGFFAQMGDSFLAAKDYNTWKKWMQYGISLYPQEVMLLVLQGDGQLQMSDKTEASKSYSAAKELAKSKNDQWVLRIIDEKLKTL